MAITEERVVAGGAGGWDIHWGAVIAGAIAAAALSFVLMTFGTGIGLAVASASPTWRDTSIWLWIVSGTYVIFVAIVSFAFGGYVAGRMRSRFAGTSPAETDFRDGMHGLLVWGLAILIGAVLALGTARVLAQAATANGAESSSVAGESTIAYELDMLFRSDLPPRGDVTYDRAQAARILLKTSGHTGVSPEDKDYLTRLVANRTGLAQPDAAARVNDVMQRAHDSLKRARESAIILAFMTAGALLLGAAVAWLAAREGGREREIGGVPKWEFALRRRALR